MQVERGTRNFALTFAKELNMPRREEWRPIPGFQERYMIGESGRVLSFRTPNPSFIKTFVDHMGYVNVKIADRTGKYRQRAVHVLLLEAFGNPRPYGAVAKFLNNDRSDVRLTNLAWVFPSAEWRQPFPV